MSKVLPFQAVDPRLAALVGMAAMFAGSSRAFLTSLIFAYEATHQQSALLPLLAGCTTDEEHHHDREDRPARYRGAGRILPSAPSLACLTPFERPVNIPKQRHGVNRLDRSSVQLVS